MVIRSYFVVEVHAGRGTPRVFTGINEAGDLCVCDRGGHMRFHDRRSAEAFRTLVNRHGITGYALHGSAVAEFNADWGLRKQEAGQEGPDRRNQGGEMR